MDMYEKNVENDCTLMIEAQTPILPTQSDNKNICVSANNLSFHPIIVVHNLHSEFLPQLRNGIQYIVSSQCNDGNESISSENIDKVNDKTATKINDKTTTPVECENETNDNYINQKSLIVDQMTVLDSEEMPSQNDQLLSASHILKNISPTEFLNITDYNTNEISSQKEINFSQLNLEKNNVDIDLDGFCNSPLLSDNAKEISLDNESHLQDRILLDVIVPKVSIFSETSEIVDDIFVTSLKNQNEENSTCSDTQRKSNNLLQESNSGKTVKLLKNCEVVLENNNIHCDDENNKNRCTTDDFMNIERKTECTSTSEETVTKSAVNAISNSPISSIPIVSSSYATEIEKPADLEKNESKANLEDSNVTNIPLTAVDVGVISIMPVESVVLGNITLLPQTSPSIKFQVLQEDGSMKCVSVDPVFQEESQAGVTLNGNTDESGTSENTTLLAEVVSPNIENVRPFKCELCSATFNRLGNYTRHKKIHTVPTKDDQRFNCEVCGKNFIQRCDLTRHMHIHSGTEPHRCSLCGKGYLRHSDLITHQRFHNKEKPFSCPYCTKGFCQKGKFIESEKRLELNYGIDKNITVNSKSSAS
ncbi:oocyte zinc finger protein XlCOF29-like [Centruroides sculpturatus]|uniref:oocyte zinc finger protein XlCOF29-like n=1 Tax=Centruroides sculpturatus TaxID=218467 RepID=UPI000C6D6DE8|nr:oocyte zinc finger protein XlCOF29-like [Centruroides sculpturatus]